MSTGAGVGSVSSVRVRRAAGELRACAVRVSCVAGVRETLRAPLESA